MPVEFEPVCRPNFGKDSIVYPIYEAMLKEGKSCEDLDKGYCEMDYSTLPGKCKTVGRGDRWVEEREALELALNDWKKYQKPLEIFTRSELPWAILKNKDFMAGAEKVLSFLTNTMRAKNAPPGSGRYKRMMGLALNWYVQFPTKETWKRLSRESREEILAKMSELKVLGMTDFIDFLVKNGGEEGIYSFPSPTRSQPGAFYLGFYFSSSTDRLIYTLRYLLEKAGLSPQLFAVLYYRYSPYRCGQGAVFMPAVGIELNGKWRVFPPSAIEEDHLEKFPLFKVNLRQALVSRLSLSRAIGGRLAAVENPYLKLSGDPISYYIRNFSSLSSIKTAQEKEKIMETLVKDAARNPLAGLLIAMYTAFDDAGSKPKVGVISQFNTADSSYTSYIEFLKHTDLMKAAKRMIKHDPECSTAFEMLGEACAKKGRLIEAQGHFMKAKGLVKDRRWLSKSFFTQLANVHFKKGRMEDALRNYRITIERDDVKAESKLMAAIMVLIIEAGRARKKDIAAALDTVTALQKKSLDESDEQTFAGLAGYFEEKLLEHPSAKETIEKVPELKAKLALIFRTWGNGYLTHRDHIQASFWYRRAIELGTDDNMIHVKLSQAYLGLKMYDEAAAALRKYKGGK